MLTFVQRTKFGNVWGFEPVMLCMFTMKDTSTVQCMDDEKQCSNGTFWLHLKIIVSPYTPASIKHLSKYNSADRKPILHLHKKAKNIKHGANHSL